MRELNVESGLRERLRDVIAGWVTGERSEDIINRALAATADLAPEARSNRALGYAVAHAQPPEERNHLFRILRERIARFAASKVGSEHADDIANTAIETLIGKYPHITRLEDVMPLTTTIAMNHIRHLWRKKTADIQNATVEEDDDSRASSDPGRDPEQQVILRNLIDRMCSVIASKRFKDRCRKVLEMVYSGVPYEEIRVTMGAQTMATLYTWVHRCHKELRSGLGVKVSLRGDPSDDRPGGWRQTRHRALAVI